MNVLTPKQADVANRVLDEESARREHLVVSLSGAHAYGFPSPDSDLDLKAIHIAKTETLLGLSRSHDKAERMEVLSGVEVDYSSNELQGVLVGILQGNGNFIERVLGAIPMRVSSALTKLQPIIRRSLSKRIHRHYRGFASSQLDEWEKSGYRSAKRLLYVLRTALTGTHALVHHEIVTDMTALIDRYDLADARVLVEQKKRGEKAELPPELSSAWRGRVDGLFALLDRAAESSSLPEAPTNLPEMEAWLLEIRRVSFESGDGR